MTNVVNKILQRINVEPTKIANCGKQNFVHDQCGSPFFNFPYYQGFTKGMVPPIEKSPCFVADVSPQFFRSTFQFSSSKSEKASTRQML
jgi:hypothetical protein